MEWYTPGPFVEAARDVMGGIDLDPASNAEANETVRATRIFTAAEDGLARPWAGRLFLNPPYSRPREFIDKLVAEYAAGQVSQAILLTNNCSDTGWFHQAARAAALMCFTRGRIAFTRPGGGGPGAALQGQTFFYFGSQAGAFAQRFSQIGLVVTTVVLERGAA
jgi:phage N-6-adenine-methyltransferase